MYDVCDGPDLGRREEGYTENEAVKYGDRREVAKPHPPVVEPVLVSIRSRCDGNRRHRKQPDDECAGAREDHTQCSGHHPRHAHTHAHNIY
jgi:hypothetical protein